MKPNSIAILGQSFGASSMFYTIAEGGRPKELSAEQDFRAAMAFHPGCQPFLALEPKWKPRQPLLFLMGDADNFTPPAPCRDLSPQSPQPENPSSKRIGIRVPTTPSIIQTCPNAFSRTSSSRPMGIRLLLGAIQKRGQMPS